MIQCQNIYKSYDTKTVLKGIDFTIPDGKIFGLLGSSGAGKTTIIKILTGQLAFDKGAVRILDKEVGDLTGEDKKQIGIMMDQFGLYERLSCADIYGILHSRVKEILQRVGLADAMKLSAANLSKGMRARLLLARVFMHAPKIIFLDEPTSGLDPQSMRAIHRIILEKKKEGCTIFLTTHNMEEATAMANVKPWQYLCGVGFYVWAICMIGAGVMSMGFSGKDRAFFLGLMGIGFFISILAGACVGIFAKNQMAATSLVMPGMMILAFLPMLSMFNEKIAKVATIFYTEQLKNILEKMSFSDMPENAVWIILINAVVLVFLFSFVYKRKGLD